MEENNQSSNFGSQPPFSDQNSDDFSNQSAPSNGNNNGNWEEPASPRRGRRLVVYVIIIVLVIFGVFWFLGYNRLAAPSPSANNTSETPSAPVSNNAKPSSISALIKVSNQPAGGVVTINSVTLDEPAWIAVEEDRDGERGNVLGALWLPAGTHTAQSVDLLRFTAPDSKYYAVLRADAGDDHKFDTKDDESLTDDSGEPIMAAFRTASEE